MRCRIKRRQWNYAVKDVLSAEPHLLEEYNDAVRNAECLLKGEKNVLIENAIAVNIAGVVEVSCESDIFDLCRP